MATIKGNSASNNLNGTANNDDIYGYAGNDTIYGHGGIDSLFGGGGNDYLYGGDKSDWMYGGTGDDYYYVGFNSFVDNVIESANQGNDTVNSTVSFTLAANVENLELAGTGNINGTGNNLNNKITGNSGHNIIYGHAGVDTLYGNGGNDTLYGGDQSDWMYGEGGDDDYYVGFNGFVDNVVEYFNEGIDTVNSTISYTLGANVENLYLNEYSDSNGTGNSLNNVIWGSYSKNVLRGGAGNDTIYGYGTYYGADSYDEIYGEEGKDTIFASSAQIFGESGDDYISGDYSNSYGGDGNDVISGYYSNNYGGDGNDAISGDYSNSYGGDGNDTITGSGNTLLSGGSGNDYIQSGGIYYYEENTQIQIGGSGSDTLICNDTKDTIVFNSPTEGIDTISNFASGQDLIEVSASGFGGGLVGGTKITFAQISMGTGATTANHRFIYDYFSNGALFFDVDGTGTSAQIQLATLVGAPALSANDIYVAS